MTKFKISSGFYYISTMDELKKKILKDIEKTGFVTELKAVSLLIENDWVTEHSSTYEDKDNNISREIDIVASKVKYINELGFTLTIYLIDIFPK